MVVSVRRPCGLWDGLVISEPVRRCGRHHPTNVARVGIYRFWRDLGYGIGAVGLGLTAHIYGSPEAAFWFVALSMFVSGAVLFWWGDETHPRLNPVPET